MTERLLQYIWQFQLFNKSNLTAVTGENIEIIHGGELNTNQGPDFTNARIRMDGAAWIGTIELHLLSSDWYRHQHQDDVNYQNVILHVVWQNDLEDAQKIPVVELKQRVPKVLLDRYSLLMSSPSFIACDRTVAAVPALNWLAWKERLLAERLIRRFELIKLYLQQNNFHWEESFWWLLARNFGTKVNADVFEEVARSIPVSLLAKHKHQVQVLEALLLGQAGLLGSPLKDAYARMLQKEYNFYRRKYQLVPVHQRPQFLRMRPGGFPTIRFAQLAMLVHHSAHLFARIREEENLERVRGWLDINANDYWHYRYRIDEPSAYRIKKLGEDMIDNIITNTIAPMLFAYGSSLDDESCKQRAIRWLEETAAENNALIRGFKKVGVSAASAFDTQALLELKRYYCDAKRCLECSIGHYLLRDL